MCTGSILLYGIPRVVMGENCTFVGGEDLTCVPRGVEVINLDSPECVALMDEFIAAHPRSGTRTSARNSGVADRRNWSLVVAISRAPCAPLGSGASRTVEACGFAGKR